MSAGVCMYIGVHALLLDHLFCTPGDGWGAKHPAPPETMYTYIHWYTWRWFLGRRRPVGRAGRAGKAARGCRYAGRCTWYKRAIAKFALWPLAQVYVCTLVLGQCTPGRCL